MVLFTAYEAVPLPTALPGVLVLRWAAPHIASRHMHTAVKRSALGTPIMRQAKMS